MPLQQAHGMTETSPLVLALPADKCTSKIGSAGVPGMHTAVRIVTEDGREAEVEKQANCGARDRISPRLLELARSNRRII